VLLAAFLPATGSAQGVKLTGWLLDAMRASEYPCAVASTASALSPALMAVGTSLSGVHAVDWNNYYTVIISPSVQYPDSLPEVYEAVTTGDTVLIEWGYRARPTAVSGGPMEISKGTTVQSSARPYIGTLESEMRRNAPTGGHIMSSSESAPRTVTSEGTFRRILLVQVPNELLQPYIFCLQVRFKSSGHTP